MKIMTDTSALYSPIEGEKLGIEVLPLSVTINNKTYKEFVDIYPDEFIELIRAGGIPTSSQPSIGCTIESFEKYPDEDIICLNMADGVSGTYQSTLAAKNSLKIEQGEHVHVINTMTLCGPHRYLVQLALQLQKEKMSTEEIIQEIHKRIAFTKSFLIPSDFAFLKRGGRLTPLSATLGGMLKITPVLSLTEDGKRLEKFAIKKSAKSAVGEIIKCYQEMGVDKDCLIYITHAAALERAEAFKAQIQKAFPETTIELLPLSPVFITQGGPGCVAVQMIRK